jgi:hypothetical protein
MKRTLFLLPVLLLTACGHTGGADEVHVKFGMAPAFMVKKDVTGIKVTNKTLVAADSATSIQILNFEWTSTAKNVTLKSPTP